MKKIVVFLLLSVTMMYAQEKVKLTLIVNTKNVNEDEKVYVTGSHNILGNWSATGVELKKIKDNVYKKTIEFNKATYVAFKFTKGSWETERVNVDSSIPPDYTVKLFNDTTITCDAFAWKNMFVYTTQFNGQITGNVKYHHNIKYKFLKQRDLIVWLPPGYDTSNERYPVLYMHDGQNIIDPATSAFGIDWQADESADSLIRNKKIPPFIVVGIYNTADRRTEYYDTDTSDIYMELVVDVIKPMIDSLYRTKPNRENTFTGGSSAGGLISFKLIWEYNDVFSKALCLSPAFRIREIDYVSKIEAYKGILPKLKVYMDNGGLGLDEMLQDGFGAMVNTLTKLGYREEKDFKEMVFPQHNHTEADWAERFPDILRWLFDE